MNALRFKLGLNRMSNNEISALMTTTLRQLNTGELRVEQVELITAAINEEIKTREIKHNFKVGMDRVLDKLFV